MTTVNWKRHTENGSILPTGKTHLMLTAHKTACGKSLPKDHMVELEFFESNYHDCKACSKAYAKNPEAY